MGEPAHSYVFTGLQTMTTNDVILYIEKFLDLFTL
jgi:hypothetical protein